MDCQQLPIGTSLIRIPRKSTKAYHLRGGSDFCELPLCVLQPSAKKLLDMLPYPAASSHQKIYLYGCVLIQDLHPSKCASFSF